MGDLVPYLAVFGSLAAVMGFFTWVKGVVRRRGAAGSAMRGALAAYEETMRVTSHESHHEVRAAADRRAEIGGPGDPRWAPGVSGGRRSAGRGRSRRRFRLRR
ncbi:hypothetical protein [Streptomyces sp. MAR4 CNX-425]|uniref:hypothetical protein n=1 Tax=Streptomyces sp. MAR4 CNX-425 TaxID=3406343 RepID=UPI003B50D3EB